MFTCIKRIYSFVSLVILSASVPVIAAELSVGGGGFWQSSPYQGHDDTVLPIPLIHFEDERFYIRGLDAGVYIWKNENQTASFGVLYAVSAFDSRKTDDRRLQALNDRHPSLDAYFQYTLQTDYGYMGIKVRHDILDNSNGFSAQAYYKSLFILGPVYVVPGVGVQWDSKNQLDYYFGISSDESYKSGLDRYTPNSAVSPFLSLEADWRFTDNWRVTAAGRVLFLNKEIRNSPMVNDKQVFNATIGLNYIF